MKSEIPLKLLCCLCFLLLIQGCSSKGYGSNSIKSVKKFRTVEVGGYIPGFVGLSEYSDKEIGPNKPEGKFFIHCISDDLPAMCLDEDCGGEYDLVVKKGGHLIGGADGKHAAAFGIKILQGKEYKFDASLIVVADRNARILAIYKNAKLKDLSVIMDDIKDLIEEK